MRPGLLALRGVLIQACANSPAVKEEDLEKDFQACEDLLSSYEAFVQEREEKKKTFRLRMATTRAPRGDGFRVIRETLQKAQEAVDEEGNKKVDSASYLQIKAAIQHLTGASLSQKKVFRHLKKREAGGCQFGADSAAMSITRASATNNLTVACTNLISRKEGSLVAGRRAVEHVQRYMQCAPIEDLDDALKYGSDLLQSCLRADYWRPQVRGPGSSKRAGSAPCVMDPRSGGRRKPAEAAQDSRGASASPGSSAPEAGMAGQPKTHRPGLNAAVGAHPDLRARTLMAGLIEDGFEAAVTLSRDNKTGKMIMRLHKDRTEQEISVFKLWQGLGLQASPTK